MLYDRGHTTEYKQFGSDKIQILKTVLFSAMKNNLNES